MGSRKNGFLHVNPQLCPHLADYRRRHGLDGYHSVQNSLRTAPNGVEMIGKPRSSIATCIFCSKNTGRLYFCLICSSIYCFDHVAVHSSETGHEISVDIERAELFCSACCDQIYDPDFDSMVFERQIMGNHRGLVRRKGELENGSLSKAMILIAGAKNKSMFPWGLRGLNNLGSTCFMNSVLQVLLHTPPLRNYFLQDGHNRETCSRRRTRKRGAAGELPCLACDTDSLFSAVFSGDRKPYSPARFLYSWWQHAENLATYEQQDAHEFFISMLDRIHEKEKNGSQQKGVSDCLCIAHKVFSGTLRSDVTCTVCGYTSTTYDPCMGLSLDMETCNSTANVLERKSKASGCDEMSTLMGCLDLFTRPEKLGSDQKLYCQHCKVRQDTLKQMSIRRLPMVLCFHIKRFTHSFVKRTSRKIDHYLQFPFSLDMTPYLSSSIVRNRFGNRIFAFEGDDSESTTDCLSEFEVFAVVTHTGRLDSGHYITYLRLRNQWYKCDDAWITQVSESVVRASQGYMVYYLQKMLYYRANEDLGCLPMSPRDMNRAARESFLSTSGCC